MFQQNPVIGDIIDFTESGNFVETENGDSIRRESRSRRNDYRKENGSCQKSGCALLACGCQINIARAVCRACVVLVGG